MATVRSGNGKRRRQMLILLAATLVLLGWLIYGMVVDLRSRPLTYHIEYAPPVNQYLCPGDALRYEVSVEVTEVPAALRIIEQWCQVGTGGICNQATSREYSVGILRPRAVYTIASRIMPDTPFFVPGQTYEYWHTTTTTTNRGVLVSGYVVGPITVRDNCEKPEGGVGGN